jgi:hypothetical protein
MVSTIHDDDLAVGAVSASQHTYLVQRTDARTTSNHPCAHRYRRGTPVMAGHVLRVFATVANAQGRRNGGGAQAALVRWSRARSPAWMGC